MSSTFSTNNTPEDKNTPYYKLCPDFSHYLAESSETQTTALEDDVKKLDVKETDTLEDKVDAYCREFLYLGGPRDYTRSKLKRENRTLVTTQNARSSS